MVVRLGLSTLCDKPCSHCAKKPKAAQFYTERLSFRCIELLANEGFATSEHRH